MDDQRKKQFHKYEMEKELKHRFVELDHVVSRIYSSASYSWMLAMLATNQQILPFRMALRAMNEYDRKVQEALDIEEKEKKVEKQKKLKHPVSCVPGIWEFWDIKLL